MSTTKLLLKDLSRAHSCLLCKNMNQQTPACPSVVLAHHSAITSGALVHNETCTTRSFLAVKKSVTKITQQIRIENTPSCCCCRSLRRSTNILSVDDSVSTLLEECT